MRSSIFVLLTIFSMCYICIAQDSKQEFLDAHNKARAEVGVKQLEWDDAVASYAQSYAKTRSGDCAMMHSGGQYGENIAWSSADLSAADAVKMWVDEKAGYDYDSNSCNQDMCGHYTQVVWGTSLNVGCASTKCNSGGTFVVCNYDPPGNYVGEKPY